MSHSERLPLLWQPWRQGRHPVRAATLAAELGVSVRTLYSRALRLGDAYDLSRAVLHRRGQQPQGVDLQAFPF